jgi:hypothetical protein
MDVETMYGQLRDIADVLETNPGLYSADEQAFLRLAAKAVVDIVQMNERLGKYSHNEDD